MSEQRKRIEITVVINQSDIDAVQEWYRLLREAEQMRKEYRDPSNMTDEQFERLKAINSRHDVLLHGLGHTLLAYAAPECVE